VVEILLKVAEQMKLHLQQVAEPSKLAPEQIQTRLLQLQKRKKAAKAAKAAKANTLLSKHLILAVELECLALQQIVKIR
jgi:hypothetical protein